MTSKPLVDHGQTLTAPAGKVIGFLDGKFEFEAFADALCVERPSNNRSLR